MDAKTILSNCAALESELVNQIAASEAEMALSVEVISKLKKAGAFSILMPKGRGGPGCSPLDQIAIIEALSSFDPAVGWSVMIGCDSGFFTSLLPEHVGRILYPNNNSINAGWYSPIGKAAAVSGGVLVNGHWSFGSGILHADAVTLGCWLEGVAGEKRHILAVVPQASVRIERVWDTLGLRGTGSNDFYATDLFVPQDQVVSLTELHQSEDAVAPRIDLLLLKMSGVPLGLAKAALNTAIALSRGEARAGELTVPGRVDFKNADVQSVISLASLKYSIARSAVMESVEAYQERWLVGPVTGKTRAMAALARYNAFQSGREIAGMVFDLFGNRAIYNQKSLLGKLVRDSYTMCQHAVAKHRIQQSSGELILSDQAGSVFL